MDERSSLDDRNAISSCTVEFLQPQIRFDKEEFLLKAQANISKGLLHKDMPFCEEIILGKDEWINERFYAIRKEAGVEAEEGESGLRLLQPEV